MTLPATKSLTNLGLLLLVAAAGFSRALVSAATPSSSPGAAKKEAAFRQATDAARQPFFACPSSSSSGGGGGGGAADIPDIVWQHVTRRVLLKLKPQHDPLLQLTQAESGSASKPPSADVEARNNDTLTYLTPALRGGVFLPADSALPPSVLEALQLSDCFYCCRNRGSSTCVCDPRCEPTPAALGIERAAYLIHGGIWILEAESEEAAARLVQTLSGRRAVAAVRRNHLLHAHQVPNDPLLLPLQWPLQQMEAANPNGTGAWSVTIGSTTIKVAIIDSGMQLDHPDLEQNVLLNDREAAVAAPSPAPGGPQQQRQDSRACSDGVDTDGNGYVDDCFGYNFLEDSSNVYDGHRHGTFLAGVVGAVGDDAVGVAGVAPQVSLLPLKIFAHGSCLASPRGGSYAVTGADSAARAANYALLRGANVSLMAFGFDCTVPQTFLAHQPASVAGRSSGSNSSGGSSNSSVGDGTGGVGSSLMMRDAPFFAGGRMVKLPEAECLFPFQDLARSASLAGQLWVMAAGNSASNNDAQPHSPSNVRGTNVLAVASTDPLDELAPSSNTGRGSVHLAAPGTSVFSTVPDYVDCGDLAQRGVGVMSGTSVAAAHVAGVAVLVASVLEACGPRRYSAPQDRAAAVRNAILASVEQVPALMNSTVSGGRVSARGAVEYAVRNFCESEQSSGSQDDAPAEADGFAGEAQQGGSQGAELPGNAGSGENGSGLTAGASPAAAAPNAAGRDDDVLLGAPDDNASFDEDFLEDDIFWQDFDQQFAADERGKR